MTDLLVVAVGGTLTVAVVCALAARMSLYRVDEGGE